MANLLSLALRINADASGLNLTPVERALKQLGDETAKVTSVFDKFAASTEAAAKAQADSQKAFDALIAARQAGTVSAAEFQRQFEALAAAARSQADAFAEGQRITEANRTEEERRAIAVERLNRLFELGAIEQETYNRAIAEASGANAEAARVAAEAARQQAEAAKVQSEALRQRQALEARAAQIINANLTEQERYEQKLRELNELQRAGVLVGENYNRAVAAAKKPLDDAAAAAEKAANANKQNTLQFNELSGIFAALPGPLGNIAGRISGLASAGEGLSRIFAGGLTQGISSLGASVAALVNPFTLAVAGIAAFGAAAVSVVRGLSALDDRVEKLGNTAAKLGVSFGFIQTLEEAARRSGTSIDAVSAAFGRLQRSVLGVDEESKAAQKALAEIGVTAEELQALSPDQQYQRIGTALASIEDPARRTAAATALFGRSGSELIPFFNNISNAAADMERFGAAISDVDRGRIDSLGDGFDQVFLSLQGLGQSVLLPFAGLVEGVARAFSGLINIVTAVAQAVGAVLGPVLDTVGAAFGLFGDAVNNTVGFFRSLFGSADETAQATEAVAESVTRSAEEIEAVSKAIDASNKALDTAITKAGEFGQAGFEAALQFQTAIEDLREQANEGELNAEQYARGVANATAEYERQIEAARQVAEENKRLAEEAKRRAEAEAQAVQRIIDASLEQLRIDEQFGGDSNRARAADNLNKLIEEQARVEEQLAAARAAGDQQAIDALVSRLATLDQVAARERDIASGAAKAREDAAKAAEDAAKEAERLAEQRARELERVNEQILTKQQEFADRQFELELDRARELATARTGSIEINDIREGGISAFFDTLQEDPAIAEARKQRQELEKIRKEIAKLNAEKVDILGGTG